MNKEFSTTLFRLIDSAHFVVVDGYEIDEFNNRYDQTAEGGIIYRLSCDEECSWYFEDQAVVVSEGVAKATLAWPSDPEGWIDGEEVTLEFRIPRPIELADLIKEETT